MMLVEVVLLKLALIWRYAFDVVTMHTYKMGFCMSCCCELWCDHLVHINDTLNKSYFSLLIWLQTAIEQKHEERFPQHKKSHKACNWKWWEPCFSFVLLVYNESFSRSFILVEEEILLELFISKIHSLEPYHILDQIKNYLDSSHHNELPKTKLVMMTGHIIVEWFLNRILLSRDS